MEYAPPRLISLLNTAKNTRLHLAPIKLPRKLKSQLPAWFHVGVPPKLYQTTAADCLRSRHDAKTICDLSKISKRVVKHTSCHKPHPKCTCKHCIQDRGRNCTNPHRCASLARNILGYLEPKFDLLTRPIKDNLSLTHHRREKNSRAVVANGDELTFDPSLTAKNDIRTCFRIFIDPERILEQPAYRVQEPRIRGLDEEPTCVYTDGSCTKNGKLDTVCGAGIWFGDNHPLNRSIRVPGPSQSNQIGELAAIVVALQSVDPLIPITCITDSRYVIDGLNVHLSTWEDQAWLDTANEEWFRAAAYHLRRRAAPTHFKWVKGHTGVKGNEEADRLANEGTQNHNPTT